MSIKADEVLELLDQHINNDPLTMLPPLMYQLWTHFFPADTRLSVFRSEEDWAVFVEIACFRPGAEDSSLEIWGYSNCLSEPALLWYDAPYQFCPATEKDADENDGETSYPETPFEFCIVRNGEHLKFAPSPEDYAAIGAPPDRDFAQDANHIGAYVLRFLCERLSHPFFMSETGLRHFLEDCWREGEPPRVDEMALLWQTQQWRHPAIVAQDSDRERPRHLPYFQALARAIETGDVAELQHQDPTTFNTDWRIWDAQERAEEAQMQAMLAEQEQAWQQLSSEMQGQLRAFGGNVFVSGHTIETLETPE